MSQSKPKHFFHKQKPKKPSVISFKLHRLIKPLTLALVFLTIAGVVYAYFTSQVASSDLVFHTGSLKIALTDPEQLNFTGLQPGDEQLLEYQVKNTGSTPVYLKGKFVGGWANNNLDNEKLKPTKLEYRLGQGDWQTLTTDGVGLGDEYFYSVDNDEATLLALAPNETISWRATFKLAEDVDNSYQDQKYQVNIHLAARQTQKGASWPENY